MSSYNIFALTGLLEVRNPVSNNRLVLVCCTVLCKMVGRTVGSSVVLELVSVVWVLLYMDY